MSIMSFLSQHVTLNLLLLYVMLGLHISHNALKFESVIHCESTCSHCSVEPTAIFTGIQGSKPESGHQTDWVRPQVTKRVAIQILKQYYKARKLKKVLSVTEFLPISPSVKVQ